MPDRVRRFRAVLAIVVVVGLFWPASSTLAHPLGNFSISQYTQILVTPDIIELHYIVDLAEIPTGQEIRKAGIVPDAGDPRVQAYLSRTVEALKAGLDLEVDGRRLPLQTASSDVIFPPGAAGLPTMKLGLVYRATVPGSGSPDARRLRYLDANFAGRVGWKEVVAVPAWGVTFTSSSVPSKDQSQALTDYPVDLLNRPPQVLEAQVVFNRKAAAPATGGAEVRPGTRHPGSEERTGIRGSRTTAVPVLGTARLAPNRQGTPRNAFTDLMSVEDLSLRIVLVGLIVAAALGAFHALEPGHGKTIVAAYLIGSRGTAWHATWLGLIVTASHTAGVYLLGAVTLYASRYVVPERLYPWLGVVSGLTIAGVGGVLLLRRAGGIAGHGHSHAHDHGHVHAHHHGHGDGDEPGHGHGHEGHASHAHDHNVHLSGEAQHHHHAHGERTGTVSLPALVALGITGGIVPCPAALVVLLSALALHRVGFGLLLIVAFSVGLAAVLIAIGMLMVFARRFMGRFQSNGPLTTRWLPLASAAVITLLGLGITVQAILAAGIPGIKPG